VRPSKVNRIGNRRPAARRATAASSRSEAPPQSAEPASDEVLAELMRRAQEIDDGYRSVAQKMGQLYLCADRHHMASLTAALDEPMRNTSNTAQTVAAILEQLRALSVRRSRRRTHQEGEPR